MPGVLTLSTKEAVLCGGAICALGAAAALVCRRVLLEASPPQPSAGAANLDLKRGSFLLLSDTDVAAALPMGDAIACNRQAFLDLARAVADVPARAVLAIPPAGGHTLFKPAYVSPTSALGLKVVSTRPDNAARGLPTVPATILMFSENTGLLTGLLQGTYLTALRTAAGSGVATALVASNTLGLGDRPMRRVLTVFGAGMQADAHIKSMLCVHSSLERLIVVNRSSQRAEALCAKYRSAFALGARVVLLSEVDKVEEAVRMSDLICTTTNSSVPMFDGKWMKAGTHVNAVGSYTQTMQELDEATVTRCAIVVDTDHALAAGDLAIPIANGMKLSLMGELGQLLMQVDTMEKSPSLPSLPQACDCTLFKSVGVAVQDIATAHAVVEAARERGIGRYCTM